MPGSPPHAWGRLHQFHRQPVRVRFTPTCVGQTSFRLSHAISVTVYPHMRGADEVLAVWGVDKYGSPPHAWGRHRADVKLNLCGSVHPHMRGADWSSMASWTPLTGSPPHAWGRRRAVRLRPFSRRFTPTCVGQTASSPRSRTGRPVHPHMRGADKDSIFASRYASGSPPHAWGRRLFRSVRLPDARFTPTCVGQTRLPDQSSMYGDGSPPHAWGRRLAAETA